MAENTQPNPKVAVEWRHKKTGKVVKVVPWMEIPDPVLELDQDEAMKALAMDKPRKVKFGCLVQIGWLIENDQNLFLGVGLKAAESFEPVDKNGSE